MAAALENVRLVDRIGGGNVDALIEALAPRRQSSRRGVARQENVRAAIHRRHAISLFRRDAERRVAHAKRGENALAQEIAERAAGNHFDQPADDVDAETVMPALARLEGEREAGEILDAVRQRAIRLEELSLVIESANRRVFEEMVGQPARMRQQIANGD